MSRRQWAFWGLFAVTLGVYLAMVLWSLPRLQVMAGGLAGFDLRPMGYSPSEARELLAALGPKGADFYLSVQLWIDSVYPGLMAAVLIFAFAALAQGIWVWILTAGAFVMAGCDYLENHAIAGLLRAGPDAVNDAMITSASGWTLWKSISSTVVFTALLVLLARAGWLRLRRH
jgi:hypothetical protein